jgi:hypothetical protein
MKWRTLYGEGFRKGWSMIPRTTTLLLLEPGTSIYNPGLDWPGLLVSGLNNLSLEQYRQKYLWSSMGIKIITSY